MEESFALNYLPLIASSLLDSNLQFTRPRNALEEREITQDNGVQFASILNGAYVISEYGGYRSPEEAPKNSVAIINIIGSITKYDQECGPSGMVTKSALLSRCFVEENIKAIVLNIDSGGGEGMACRLMQETINLRNKPVIGFCNDFVGSAAYGIASCCDKVVANSDVCRVGSIGTYMTVLDMRKRLENMGIKLIEVYASKSTKKNQVFYKAINGDTGPLTELCDKYNDSFIESINKARSGVISSDQNIWATGEMFFAQDALNLGLIDDIDSFNNVINYFNT